MCNTHAQFGPQQIPKSTKGRGESHCAGLGAHIQQCCQQLHALLQQQNIAKKNLDVTYRIHNNLIVALNSYAITSVHHQFNSGNMAGKHPSGYCPVFGNYPKEYNRAVHGPFYPWVNYGPRDTPLGDVKLGEIKTWFARRQKTPAAALAAFSRYIHLWSYRWNNTRYGAVSKPFLQCCVWASIGSLLVTYGHYRKERMHKYHW